MGGIEGRQGATSQGPTHPLEPGCEADPEPQRSKERTTKGLGSL